VALLSSDCYTFKEEFGEIFMKKKTMFLYGKKYMYIAGMGWIAEDDIKQIQKRMGIVYDKSGNWEWVTDVVRVLKRRKVKKVS
jgi:hypothetical protein